MRQLARTSLVCLLLLLGGFIPNSPLAGAPSESDSRGPRYVLKLSLNEFSILNAAEVDGLMKYGGSGEFALKISREGQEVFWTVTIDNPRLMELLGIYVGEKTVKLVQGLDTDSIGPNEKVALQAIKTLSRKLEQAQKNPVWDSVKLSGIVARQGTNWLLHTRQGIFGIEGIRPGAPTPQPGSPVIAEGFVKAPGRFDLVRFFDKKANTLELFVMSLCPFGQRAQTALFSFLERTNLISKPGVEVRYIFYKQQKDGNESFASLHGEEEITENLVQMVIRDHYPALLKSYIRARAAALHTPWPLLAEQVGLSKMNIADIQGLITTQRQSLIRSEYDYATSRYAIFDGSPTYVWEGEIIRELRGLDVFKDFDGLGSDACAK